MHGGKKSRPINLAEATEADIVSAFNALQDDTYSKVAVKSILVNSSSVLWTIELTTPWSSCGPDYSHPLVTAEVSAKVSVETMITSGPTCLSKRSSSLS